MASDSLRLGSTGLGPGTVLDGKYEILTRIGAGGMGEVFKARHVHLNTFRCIKVMKQGLLADEGYRLRFLREARLATQIHHPNIAVVHDFFLGEGGSYMVTEFIDGTTLRQWSASFGRFPLAIAADVASQVLAGLDHIHRRGLLHRDISPDNVMLSYDPDDRLIAKIIDLGIAKDMSTANTDTTQAGVFVGNPKYMSPEQFGAVPDGEQIDGRTDLYSLGIVLYEMLLGVSPFKCETPQGYIVKHLTEPPMAFAAANPTLTWPEGMESVIFRALEKDRKKRFSNARDFAHTLHKFLSAPIGSLSREEVFELRGVPVPPAPTPPTMAQEMPWGHDSPTVAEKPMPSDAKEKLFELELLEQVRDRQQAGDREGLQRLAEAHPKGSAVGDLARDAIALLTKAKQRDQEEETAFQLAWEYGSSAAWRAFVDAHPGSSRIDRAQKLLEEAVAFESAAGGVSDTGLREFLKVWPDGRHHLEAEIRLIEVKQKLADRAFEEACAADTYAALRDFGVRFPTSQSVEEARRLAAERLAFETAASADHEEAWDTYLAKWSADRHAADARARRDAAKAREEEGWRRATEGKTAAAWATFATDFPHSKRIVRAERNRREAVAFDEAKGGRAAMQEFVRAYADGLLIKEAQRLLRQLADDDDFQHAQSLDKPGAWQLYLATHPSGAHAQSARERLTGIEDAAYKIVLAAKDPKAGAEFLADFKESPRREELTAHIGKWEQSALVKEALAAIGKGDCDRAESLLARITDDTNRKDILAALESARDQQRWDAARKDDSIPSLKAYLEAHPKGRWVKDAQKRLMKLHAASEASEPRDWDLAWEAGTVAAWDQYLTAHPDSRRVDEARVCRQEATDFDVAQKANSSSMWRAFIKTWPEGRHRIDAEIRMRSAR